MTSHEIQPHTLAGACEPYGSEAVCHDFTHHQYGRRIERDGSWSVYHVFTGIPAKIQGHALTGLTHSRATEGMLSLNRRNDARRHYAIGAVA